ncbi:hypothetical protein T31B1_07738 [Salinisphaera sp. T31B1]
MAILFCPGCRWQTRASWMALELFNTFGDALGEIALVPAGSGVFEIRLNNECLHSRARDGSFPELKPIKQRIRDRIQPDRDLGHSEP